MICPNCKNKVGYGIPTCPKCFSNLSFTTKKITMEQIDSITEKTSKVIRIAKIIKIIIFLLPIISIIGFIILF